MTKSELYALVLHSLFAGHTFLTRNLSQATKILCWGTWMARHKTICCLDQKYMHVFYHDGIYENLEILSQLVNPINVTNQTFSMKHRPVAPGLRVSRTSVAMRASKWTPTECYVNL